MLRRTPRPADRSTGPEAGWAPDISLVDMRAQPGMERARALRRCRRAPPRMGGPAAGSARAGPPRSGKTSSVVVPNVLAAPGPVLTTSTKPDVMEATLASRAQYGRVLAAGPDWHGAGTAGGEPDQVVTGAGQSFLGRGAGYSQGDDGDRTTTGDLWRERSLDRTCRGVAGADVPCCGCCRLWHDRGARLALRHDLHTPMAVLARHDGNAASLAIDVLAGIADTEEREKGAASFRPPPARWPPTVRHGRYSWPSTRTLTPTNSPTARARSTSARRPGTKHLWRRSWWPSWNRCAPPLTGQRPPGPCACR